MKTERQGLIRQIINDRPIETQEALRDALLEKGMNVTQATVSRDIRELALIKLTDANGVTRYTLTGIAAQGADDSGLSALISSSVLSADFALNTVVLKCHTGYAQAVCAKLDATNIENVVGTIAGDDTIFILMRTEKDAAILVRKLNSIIDGDVK